MLQVPDYSKMEGTKISAQRLAALIDMAWWSGNQRWFNFLFSLSFILIALSIQNGVAPAQGKQAETMISMCGWLVQSRWNFLGCAVYFEWKHFLSSLIKQGHFSDVTQELRTISQVLCCHIPDREIHLWQRFLCFMCLITTRNCSSVRKAALTSVSMMRPRK